MLAAFLSHASRHLRGMLLVRRLGLKHRSAMREARALALYLETEVFPELKRAGADTLELTLTTDGEKRRLAGAANGRTYRFPGTEELAGVLSAHAIESLLLDTELESGQIVEAVLVLLHVRNHLSTAQPSDDAYLGWQPARIAAAMLGADGYHKFCARMRFDRELSKYEVRYSYCELFFSRAVKSYLEHRRRYRDHRALFHAAPRAAILALLAFALPAALLMTSSALSAAASLLLAVVAAFVVGLGVYTLGSLEYTREHHDLLLQEHYNQVRILSRFPQTNPNIVIKLDQSGRPTYLNPAAWHLLQTHDLTQEELDQLLPDDAADLVSACLSDPKGTREAEVTRFGRSLRYLMTAFADEQAVIVSGMDVTYLRKIERELRVLNQNLEELVAARTHELHETQDVTIMSLAGLAETRDPETGQHLERTRLYAKELAEALRYHPRFQDVLDDEAIDRLFKSTPLHDIGKVGVPDAILRKPGALNREEWEEMRRHVQYGGDTLRLAEERLGFDSFLSIARDIAYHHHERWDGTGYPRGLAGDSIPWAARIMALVDVYDALTSKRVYKEAFSHERTRDIIVEGRGTHFDPDAVDAFLACEDAFAAIGRQYADDKELVGTHDDEI